MIDQIKLWGLIVVIGSTLSLTVASGQSKEEQMTGGAEAKVPLPLCPVMGEPVDFFISTPTNDGPVYLCCKPCITKLNKNPAEYAEKVAAQRAALARLPRIQVVCPVSGKPIKNDVFVEQNGQKVYFCCPGCGEKFKAGTEKFKAQLAASYTYQTSCPVDGERIDPSVFVKAKGDNKIFLHSAACKEAFLKAPTPYLPKLEAQGIVIEATDIVEK